MYQLLVFLGIFHFTVASFSMLNAQISGVCLLKGVWDFTYPFIAVLYRAWMQINIEFAVLHLRFQARQAAFSAKKYLRDL